MFGSMMGGGGGGLVGVAVLGAGPWASSSLRSSGSGVGPFLAAGLGFGTRCCHWGTAVVSMLLLGHRWSGFSSNFVVVESEHFADCVTRPRGDWVGRMSFADDHSDIAIRRTPLLSSSVWVPMDTPLAGKRPVDVDPSGFSMTTMPVY